MRGLLNKAKKVKYLKHFLRILCYFTFVVGIIFTIVLLFPVNNFLFMAMSYFIPQITGFLMFLYLPTTLLLLKLTHKKRFKNWSRISILVIGLLLTFLNALPLMSFPVSIQTAETEFSTAYCVDLRCDIQQN